VGLRRCCERIGHVDMLVVANVFRKGASWGPQAVCGPFVKENAEKVTLPRLGRRHSSAFSLRPALSAAGEERRRPTQPP
jgi:hypothetical protein